MTELVAQKVLVLDGEARSALAVTRSLGARGVPVIVAATSKRCLAGSSRYCREAVVYPSPTCADGRFEDSLMSLVREHKPTILLPMTDLTIEVVAGMRHDLPESVCVPIPSVESLGATLDKLRLMEAASAAGIQVPQTWDATFVNASPTGRFPLVVKPRRSWQRVGSQWVTGQARIVSDEDDLAAACGKAREAGLEMIAQEYVPGWGEGLFVLCNRGSLRAAFAHRRLRETPPDGGVSTLRESIAFDSGLLSLVGELLGALNWHGPAMFEFRVDSRNGIRKLLEVNPRFWGSLHLAIASGQDFPWLLYRMECDGDVARSEQYATGVRSRWLLGDFNRLLLSLRPGQHRQASRGRELLDFLKLGGNTRLEIESARDPKPMAREYVSYAAGLARTMLNYSLGGQKR